MYLLRHISLDMGTQVVVKAFALNTFHRNKNTTQGFNSYDVIGLKKAVQVNTHLSVCFDMRRPVTKNDSEKIRF